MSVCEECVVRNRAICGALNEDELLIMNRIGHKQVLKAGQTFMWEGDDSTVVANVIDGVLKLTNSLDDGREQIVGLAFPADFIGRPFQDQVKHTVTALTDTHICSFSRSGFEQFAHDHPNLEHKVLERTLDELDQARDWMLLLGRKTAAEKLATFLINMSERTSNTGCATQFLPQDSFKLPFGRQQIADILGLTIETVSRQLTDLSRKAVVELPGKRDVVIKDRGTLMALANLQQ
ncbi:MAG: Crp/Fnr family transcriptional regulator FnrL [Parasphingorhabdus sp.]